MKKFIIYLFISTGIMLLSACGSDSRKDPVPPATPPPGGYAFVNVPSELHIEAYREYSIAFQLTKDGLVVPDAIVSMKVPDKSIGTLQAYTVTTNANGEGSFTYMPPVVFPEKGSLNMVYSDGNITLEQDIALHFNLDTDVPGDGHATTLSIAYETSECDDKRGIIGHYHVHAVDGTSHSPLVNMPIGVSLINGIKEIHNEKIQIAQGTIYNTDPVEFIDKSVNFFTETKVENGDNLMIFPSEGKTDPSYLGGWKIKEVNDDLILEAFYYNLPTTANLTYIIGNEQRLLGGENGSVGVLANAHVEPSYVTDNKGYIYFDIIFDPILAGHTVTVEAHGVEDEKRIGTAMKIALRLDGDSFTAPDTLIPNDGGLEVVRVPISINPTCTGTQPLIDVPVNPNSFHVTPEKNCYIIPDISEYKTDGSGAVSIAVQTDGNITATEKCTLKWDGDISSLVYEY